MAEVMHPIRRTVWLIYHVPKTGGQTLRYHLRQELGSEGHAHLGRFEPHLPLFTTDDLAGPAADDVRVVTGHPVSRATGRLFPEARILDVLVLRDPLARVVSHWMWQTELRRRKGRPPRSFVEFASRLGPNPMTRHVAGLFGETRPDRALDHALHGLGGITVVGTLDRLDELTPPLLAAMQLTPELPPRKNRSGVEIPILPRPPEAVLEAWVRRNREDAILFDAARQFEDRSLQRLHDLAQSGGSA
jgi:hypothetical protein